MTNRPETADRGRIRVGAAMRLPAAKPPAAIIESGKIKIGAAMRLPVKR